jgi:hypothetical protein
MKFDFKKIQNIDIRLIMLAAIGILFLMLLQQCNATKIAKSNLAVANQNNFALRDTIRTEKNKANELQFQKGILLTSEKGLRDLNGELYDELKKQGDDIAFLQKIVGKLSTPKPPAPIPGNGGVTGNPCDSSGTYFAEWKDNRKFDSLNWRRLEAKTDITVQKGKVTEVKTDIITDEIGFNLVTGIKENREGNFEIFVKSDYPGFVPTRIDGAFIPRKDLFPAQKKKNWSVGAGPQIGVGAGGLNGVSPVWYIGIGVGLQYSFFRF